MSTPRGRYRGAFEGERRCAHPGCGEPGEYRAPVRRPGSALLPAGMPPEWQYLCLAHVREFNAAWNYFDGMTPEEIHVAQSPYPHWEGAARAFATNATGPDRISDALGILNWRRGEGRRATPAGRVLSAAERRALGTLGLGDGATLAEIKARYRERVRRFHPDSNGGDRGQEDKLRAAVEAHDLLVASGAFA
ncbi:J domain-containing protein [Sandaracinobacteroides saxicola]|uniref:DnaJ domain-containing protein n=1 Tax=Sandaracinobacteroides saxicola TaxID=2759707 RepID=A0A7G5IH27_9SPHN|nr:DnaJ domain-containing protein [Sandaracinobacteroides saxicola]QMW22669.1 DnaJ domain-containing protein [Sandaracinobacteroides saxicola]